MQPFIREMQLKSTMSYHLRPIRMAITKKTRKKGVHKNMEQRELLCTPGESTRWGSHYGKQYGGFSRIKKKKIPYNPPILLLSIHPKKMKSGYQKDMTTMFIASLFITDKIYLCVCSVAQWCQTLCAPKYCTHQAPLSMGISWQEHEWVAISSSRASSELRDGTRISCTAGGFLTAEPPGKPTHIFM